MKLREVFRTSKRLYVLVLLTMAAAIPALATTCTQFVGSCPDGTEWGEYVCCDQGMPYAGCYCQSWSRSGGYSGCSGYAGCAG